MDARKEGEKKKKKNEKKKKIFKCWFGSETGLALHFFFFFRSLEG